VSPNLLEIRSLRVSVSNERGAVDVVRGIDFDLEPGGTMAIIGESGSGKSLTALAVLGLLPDNARMSGSIRFAGEDIGQWSDAQLCRLRGNRIAMVFQDPMTALDPVQTIGRQVAEPLRIHRGLDSAAARAEALSLLQRVALADPARRMDNFPHQLSGGQRQRVMLAMALACGPDLLIADEPTTALDVTSQQQILALMADCVRDRGMGLILISHDLAVVAANVARVLVMYGGLIVEAARTEDLVGDPIHPYTRGLFAARPQLGQDKSRRLATIPGNVPDIGHFGPGCPFAGRCSYVAPECKTIRPAERRLDRGRQVWCSQLDRIGANGTAGAA
jgi:peptide/nickel transport system ATP-binding protein